MGLGAWLGLGVGSQVKEVGEGVSTALGGVKDLAIGLRSAITGDMAPETKARLEEIALKLEEKVTDGQQALNVLDAQSGSLFIRGWRPALGWSCAIAIFAYYPMRIFIISAAWCFTFIKSGGNVPFEIAIPMSDIFALVFSLLGMGGLRTYEKKNGIS